MNTSCEICKISFKNWRQLQAHKLSTHSEKIKCKICGKLVNKSGFKNHYKSCSKTKIEIYRRCLNCENDFLVSDENFHRNCCSLKCARSFSTKSKREQINKKVSSSLKNRFDRIGRKSSKPYNCKICQKPIKKTKNGFCLKCWKKSPEYSRMCKESLKKVVESGKHKGWTSRNKTSYAEKFFIKVLDSNGFSGKYIHEFKILKCKYTNESGNWFLDFYFPELNIDLEIDGKQHDYEDRKIHDQKRDAILVQNGFRVYRIKWRHLTKQENKDYIKNEIEKLLQYLRSVA